MYFLILPVYVRDVIGGSTSVYTLLLALFSVGTGLGALLCELLSRRKVEIGLVPFGSIGMTLFGLDLYFALPQASGMSGMSVSAFLATGFGWRLVIDLVLMAIFSGFFIVRVFGKGIEILHDFFGNAVFCILQLRQVTFGADHQMFDANILRALDAGIRTAPSFGIGADRPGSARRSAA